MKLKYILPVATIASVAAAVTPLAVSCGKEWYATWTKGTEYKPMAPKDKQEVEWTKAGDRMDALTQLYHDDIKKKPAIYSDDYINFLSQEAQEKPDQFDIREVKHKLTKVGDIEEPYFDFKATKMFRISCKLYVDGTINMMEQTFEYAKRTAELKNIPIIVDFHVVDDTTSGADIMYDPAKWDIDLDDQWSIDMPEIVNNGTEALPKLGIGDSNKVYNKSNIPETYAMSQAFKKICEYMIYVDGSNYYKNVVGIEKE